MYFIKIIVCVLLVQTTVVSGARNMDTSPSEEEMRTILEHVHPGPQAVLNSIRRNKSPTNATILVLGTVGAGKSATIRSIFRIPLPYDDDDGTMMHEHTIHVPLTAYGIPNSHIKILDTPGFGVPSTAEKDAAVITSIQNYIADPQGLNGVHPTVILVISRFDEYRASMNDSIFVQMLKRVEFLKQHFGSYTYSAANIIFVFTYFLSSTNAIVRRPQARIENFSNIIKKYTTFDPPILITVAENRCESYDLIIQDGHYKLPNKEFYPKNVMDKMIESTQIVGDSIGQGILENVFSASNLPVESSERIIPVQSDSETYQISNEMKSDLLGIKFNVIWKTLQQSFPLVDQALKIHFPSGLETAQLAFQNANITTLADIPGSQKATIRLLKKLPSDPFTIALLQKAFSLNYSTLNSFSVIGYSYDVLGDNLLSESPFDFSNLEPCALLGFTIPSITTCSMATEEHDVFQVFRTYEDYSKQRQLEMYVTIPPGLFTGVPQSGYNILIDHLNVPDRTRLSAVRQKRQFQLQLITTPPLSPEFIHRVESLTPFMSKNKESVREWQEFFNYFGSHVVSMGYGGGYMESSISGLPFEAILKHPLSYDFERLKQSVPFFLNLPASLEANPGVVISFEFFGGVAPSQFTELDENQRKLILQDWKESLETEPVIFKSHVTLTPLSYYVKQHNESIGAAVEEAANLLLQGKLRYEREMKFTSNGTAPISSLTSRIRCTPSLSPAVARNDYQKNYVGQGYHILEDAILETSPFHLNFTLRSLRSFGRVNVMTSDLLAIVGIQSCDKISYKEFRSFEEYAKHRLKDVDIYSEYNEQIMFRSVKPGCNIKAIDRFSSRNVLTETRDVKIRLAIDELRYSTGFKTAVENLPHAYDADCRSREIWRNFFHTFGTHVIISGYGGKSKEEIYRGSPASLFEILKRLDTCRQEDSNVTMQSDRKVSVLRYDSVPLSLGLEYKSMCDLGIIRTNQTLFLGCNYAFDALKYGHLSPC